MSTTTLNGIEEIKSLESNYFGGLFDRLGQGSRRLTALAWDNYPDNSYQKLEANIKEFSPYIADLISKYGIDFAVLAPNEPDPSEDLMWQLIHNCLDFNRVREFDDDGYEAFPAEMQKTRIYTAELFFDIPSENHNELAEQIEKNYDDLCISVNEFCQSLLQEIESKLKEMGLSLEQLQSLE